MKIRHTFCRGCECTPGRFSLKSSVLALIPVIMVFLILYSPLHVHAQGDDGLIVLPPDISTFPILTTQIKPPPATDGSAADLEIADLTVQENGRTVEVIALAKQRGGVHFTLVINGDRRLDVRDSDGNAPYDRIRTAFSDWVSWRRFSPGDTFSLVTQEGAMIRNTIDRETWIEALENYQPNFRTMVPDLASLETAINLTAERVVPFGVDKALLYITPPPTPEEIAPVIALTETARSAGIRVHVWMIGEDFFLSNDQGGALINLAGLTGGEFFHFTGMETLPDPEIYLDGMGVFYTLSYESLIRERGTFAIRVIASTPSGEISGESGEFLMDVQPPKPILLSPPAMIVRQPPQDWEGDLGDLAPASLDIEIMLEFPDHYSRDLTASRLYVDGRLVAERTIDPFTTLTWDLTRLVEPGEYSLQVEVTDSLGLSGLTILTPIRVDVRLPEAEPAPPIQQIGILVIWVILAVAVILLMIWLARHFLQSPLARQLAAKFFDTQRKTGRAGSDLSDEDGIAYPTLIPLDATSQDWEGKAVHITERQTTFGSDPAQVNQVLEGKEIAGVHARLRLNNGGWWISDCGSSGGTWVNYNRMGREPYQLSPGDVIHFGSAGFRFTMIDVESPPLAVVTKYEPIL